MASKKTAVKKSAKKPTPKKSSAKAQKSTAKGSTVAKAKRSTSKKSTAKSPAVKKLATKKRSKKSAKRAPTTKASSKSADLWQLIEDAWIEVAPDLTPVRAKPSEDNLGELDEAVDDVIDALRAKLRELDRDALMSVDRALERALYEIDRAAVQAVTDGSDDGFLYCRGFIVAMGKTHYDAVNANPANAVCDAELESMCYLPWHIYQEKFGDMPASGISRESGSNVAGWR
jgi:Protein of unknown function (DUF4240)